MPVCLDTLPNELWWLIFEELPFVDLFNATHVCAGWRSRALASPRLWSRPTLFTYDNGKGVPNPATLPAILARSRSLLLDATVEDHATRRMGTNFQAVASALELHTDRIARLCVRSGHVDAPQFLLSRLGSLPKLTALTATRLPTQAEGYFYVFPFSPNDLALPALEHLELDRGFGWPKMSHTRLTTVRSLSLTPRQNLEDELAEALSGCPEVSTLRVDVSVFTRAKLLREVSEALLETVSALRDRVASLESITIAGREPDTPLEAWALRTFHQAKRPCFSLEYMSRCTKGWSILRDLGTASMKLSYTDKVFKALATDQSGRIRSVTLQACDDATGPTLAVDRVLSNPQLALQVDARGVYVPGPVDLYP